MKIPLFSLEEILEYRERERLHFHLSTSITESLLHDRKLQVSFTRINETLKSSFHSAVKEMVIKVGKTFISEL